MKEMKKYLILLAACVLAFCQGCGTKSASQPAPKGETEINILSVNDIHAEIDMFPKFAAMVDSLREVYPDLLVFSAGDNRTGNPVNDQFDPVNYPVITLMNESGFDLSAVGNHEWDGNIVNFQKDIERARFPFICANVYIPDTVKLDVKPYVILEHKGIKLAVLGLIEVRSGGIPGAHPNNLKKVSFRKAPEVLPEYRYLKDESDAFILLSHCGVEEDVELALAYPWMDVILGGHSHALMDPPLDTNGVLITQSGAKLKFATLTTLKFKDGKLTDRYASVLNVSKFSHEKPEVRAMVDGFNDAPALNEALAIISKTLDNKEEIGSLMTDALREVSGADFAFQNTGGIRESRFEAGPITVKDVYCIDPFNNEVVVFEMTGAQVKQFILASYRKNGRHPSPVSGMTYKIGEDEKSVWVEAPDFSTSKHYKVAINSFMASTIDMEALDEGQSTFKTSEEMIIEFLKNHKEVDYQGVSRTN
jgi:5'-nucleotidase